MPCGLWLFIHAEYQQVMVRADLCHTRHVLSGGQITVKDLENRRVLDHQLPNRRIAATDVIHIAITERHR